MARVRPEAAEVNARILYWGIEGAGKRTNLEGVFAKLRPDHRGQMREVPTRVDPSVSYAVLPIELGEVASVRTRIELVAVPGGPEQAPTRKQLLDQVDGIVLVIDSDPARAAENAALLEELRKGLADYARRLEDLPLVVQYNKRDLTDDYGIDELHRRLGLGSATVFEAVGTEGRGLLQTLSTISKKVMRALRDESIGHPPAARAAEPAPAPRPAPPKPAVAAPAARSGFDTRIEIGPPPAPRRVLEDAILEETEQPGAAALDAQVASTASLLDSPWHDEPEALAASPGPRIGRDLSIVSVGQATRVDARSVRVPLVLGDRDGETATLVLTIQLDALSGDGDDA
jgi:hypothetical protein